MKKGHVVSLVLILAALMLGCGSAPAPAPAAAAVDANVPDFVTNPPNAEDVIYGVGSAKMSNSNAAMGAAQSRARVDISTKLNVQVQAMITDYTREAGSGDQTSSLNFYESISRQLTNANLKGVNTVKQQQTPDGTWWVLMSLSKSDAAKEAAAIIDSEASKYAEFKAMDALQRMEAQLEK